MNLGNNPLYLVNVTYLISIGTEERSGLWQFDNKQKALQTIMYYEGEFDITVYNAITGEVISKERLTRKVTI